MQWLSCSSFCFFRFQAYCWHCDRAPQSTVRPGTVLFPKITKHVSPTRITIIHKYDQMFKHIIQDAKTYGQRKWFLAKMICYIHIIYINMSLMWKQNLPDNDPNQIADFLYKLPLLLVQWPVFNYGLVSKNSWVGCGGDI